MTQPNEMKHGNVWITPRGEYAVLMSYEHHARQCYMTTGEYLKMRISPDLKGWLWSFGPEAPGIEDTSDDYMWRHRSFVPGTEGLHVFFFYRRRPAIMFKLRWT